jgi:hypothetical protein
MSCPDQEKKKKREECIVLITYMFMKRGLLRI